MIKFIIYISIAIPLAMVLNNFILAFIIPLPVLFVDLIIIHYTKDTKSIKARKEVNSRQWIQNNYESLKETYKNKFIAVINEEVIESDENLSALKDKLARKYKNINKITIEFINPQEVRDVYSSLKKTF